MTSTFASKQIVSLAATAPDPTKHVLYTRGMVLGEDDLTQEFAYLSGQDQWRTRDLIGYGTVCGLAVTIEGTPAAPEVAVSPGVAASPRGHMIRVTPKQCARLNDWLKAHDKEVVQHLTTSPPDALTLYVVLSYRDCPMNPAPIPGEPCRSEDAAMAPSRLQDDFKLELSFTPPDQREEDAVRDFVDWLRRVPIVDEPGTPQKRKAFEDAIRAAAHPSAASPLDSPPAVPVDYMYGSPPGLVSIPASEVCSYLRAAFRIWATELRPRWQANWWDRKCACSGPRKDAPDIERLLLAVLTVPLTAGGSPPSPERSVDPARTIGISEEKRPYLIHLRMLQEWLLCGRVAPSAGPGSPIVSALAGDVTGPLAFNRVRGILNLPVDLPAAATSGDVLRFRGTRWQVEALPPGPASVTPNDAVHHSEVVFGIAAAPGTSNNYSRADHTHGTPPDPIPAHKADATAHTLAGDAVGPVGGTTVARLQSRNVSTAAPSPNDVLTWSGSAWEPRPGAAAALPRPQFPFVKIAWLDTRIYELWFNLDGPDNGRQIRELLANMFDVLQETNAAPFLSAAIAKTVTTLPQRNTFRVTLEAQGDPDFLRFRFSAPDIQVIEGTTTRTVLDLIKAGAHFMGFDGSKTITSFVRVRRGS